MAPDFKMGLYLLARPEEQVNRAEEHYRRTPHHTVQIAGEQIEFVFASQRLLNDYGRGSHWGFKEGNQIYISKNVHPATVPFIAFYLHTLSLDEQRLEEKLGTELIRRLSNESVEDLILALTLDQAKQFLRPPELAALIEGFRTGPDYDPLRDDKTISAVVGEYLKVQDATALMRREQTSIGLYQERMAEYQRGHHYNKWTRRSECYNGLVGPVATLFENDVVRSDRTMDCIKQDPELLEQAATLKGLAEQLARMAPGQLIEVPQKSIEHKLLYFCSEDVVRKSAPVTFVRDVAGEATALVKIEPRKAGAFFNSLSARLGYLVQEEIGRTNQMLADLSEMVTGVNEGRPEVFQLAYDYAAQLGLLPKAPTSDSLVVRNEIVLPALEDVQDRLGEHYTGLVLAATGADGNTTRILKARRAAELLEGLGLPTTAVKEVVLAAVAQASEPLKRYARNQLL